MEKSSLDPVPPHPAGDQILQDSLPKLSLLQLPVPVFLPGRSDGADPAKETTQPDPPEEELDSKSEDEESDKEDGHKDRAVTRRRQSKGEA